MFSGEFQWLDDNEIDELYANGDGYKEFNEESEYGYIIESDIDYPEELHDLHNDFPLAPENLKTTVEMLSEFQQSVYPEHELKNMKEKLSPNLMNKKNYVAHYMNMKYYDEVGLVVHRPKRVLKFKQSPWLKSYVDRNNGLRAMWTANKLWAKIWKDMTNIFYGKSQQNVRAQSIVELITDKATALKRVSSNLYRGCTAISKNTVIMYRKKGKVKLDKPLYVGFSVLDISKLVMQRFFYDKIRKWWGDKVHLCGTDTDSFILHIETEDLYEDLKDPEINAFFDFSNYPTDHPLYDASKARKCGLFKDELESIIAREFVGIKPKLYSLLFFEVLHSLIRKCKFGAKNAGKSIKKDVLRRCVTHAEFRKTRLRMTSLKIRQNLLRSKSHKIHAYQEVKVAMTAFDSKRYLLDDNIHTLAFGHYRTKRKSGL